MLFKKEEVKGKPGGFLGVILDSDGMATRVWASVVDAGIAALLGPFVRHGAALFATYMYIHVCM